MIFLTTGIIERESHAGQTLIVRLSLAKGIVCYRQTKKKAQVASQKVEKTCAALPWRRLPLCFSRAFLFEI
jgi:hypothetical protein